MSIILAAAVEDHPFLETPIGTVIVFLFVAMFFLAGMAAGVAGIRSLIRAWVDGRVWSTKRIKERRRREEVLDMLLSDKGWANGAHNIVEAHRDLYNKIAQVSLDVTELKTAVEKVLTDKP